jgi:uncharacterized protein
MSSTPVDDTPPDEAQPVRSPCIKVCVLDADGMCVGCGRRIDEIAGWAELTAQQQRSICERAAHRLSQSAGSVGQGPRL